MKNRRESMLPTVFILTLSFLVRIILLYNKFLSYNLSANNVNKIHSRSQVRNINCCCFTEHKVTHFLSVNVQNVNTNLALVIICRSSQNIVSRIWEQTYFKRILMIDNSRNICYYIDVVTVTYNLT